jgi:hypothetical protein
VHIHIAAKSDISDVLVVGIEEFELENAAIAEM